MRYLKVMYDKPTGKVMVKKAMMMAGNAMDLAFGNDNFAWRDFANQLFIHWCNCDVLFPEMASFEPNLIEYCMEELSTHVVRVLEGGE